jgi:hypothetical protein
MQTAQTRIDFHDVELAICGALLEVDVDEATIPELPEESPAWFDHLRDVAAPGEDCSAVQGGILSELLRAECSNLLASLRPEALVGEAQVIAAGDVALDHQLAGRQRGLGEELPPLERAIEPANPEGLVERILL